MKDVVVVPHTHWDREWYRTFQEFRIRLVEMTDRVLHFLESDRYPYFLLDGQTIVLEDYLAIKPHRRETIKSFVTQGKLGIGPWYILPDEFLVSGESIIRNLARGIRIAREFGSPAPTVGYLPDMFGHTAQMPQILSGFGCTMAVVWRGLDLDRAAFRWEAPDGTPINGYYLMDGYHNVTLTDPMSPETRLGQVNDYLQRFKEDCIYYPAGTDHLAPTPKLPETIKEVSSHFPDYHFKIGAIEKSCLPNLDYSLPVKGELRYPSRAYLLPGVFSSRMELKQENARCQNWLERYLEPIAAQALAAGCPIEEGFLDEAWHLLLQNHPHDSICGCSIDQVHREMFPRFDQVRQIAATLTRNTLVAMAPSSKAGLVLYNPTSWPLSEWMEATLDVPVEEAPEQARLVDEHGTPVPCHLERYEDVERFFSGPDFVPYWKNMRRYYFQLKTPVLAPFGMQTVHLDAKAPSPEMAQVSVEDLAIENQAIRLWVEKDRVMLSDKRKGCTYEDVLSFEDEGDAGDEYNFSSPARDQKFVAKLVDAKLVAEGPVVGTLRVVHALEIPKALTTDRQARSQETVKILITSDLTLRGDAPRVEIRTELENNACDHRLRVKIRHGCSNAKGFYEGHFGVFEAEPVKELPLPVPPLVETPAPTIPYQSFVAAGELAVAAIGLPEAEFTDGAINITLLRAVGWLSRDDMRTRGGGAGPRLETPEAQGLGVHSYEYAIIPYQHLESVAPQAHRFVTPVYAVDYAKQEQGKSVLSLGISNPNLVVSALKPAGDNIVLRLYNPTPDPLVGALEVPGMKAFASNLLEEEKEPVGEGSWEVELRPYGILTYLLKSTSGFNPSWR